MNGGLYLLMLTIAYSLVQSSFLFDTMDQIKLENQTYAHRIVNQHLYLIAYCSSGENNCHANKFTNGYIPTEYFLDDLFRPFYISRSQDIISCYNNGYIFSFFTSNKLNNKYKFNFNEEQVFSYAVKYSKNRFYTIDNKSTFYIKMPEQLCSINGMELMKKDINFFLVNYIGA